MAEKSIEARVAELERKVSRQEKIIKSVGLDDDFQPVALAAKMLYVTPKVIYVRLKKPEVKLDVHYKKKGRCYLINVEEWKNLIAADDEAKTA